MDYLGEVLSELTARLPELEWKISQLNKTINLHSLPKGLFRANTELSATDCINEIKADIHTLSQQKNQRGAHFLASRVKQKISVLVALCQINTRKNKSEAKTHFGVTMLSTRQQWIQALEAEVATLNTQREAMSKTLQNITRNGDTTALLALKAELGEVERRLTLAQETYHQAVSGAELPR